MNTRLQVEHPVTECITGTDLVAWQLAVANGERLPLTQAQVERRGHAIEVRLYAEDPSKDFLPTFGRLHAYEHGPAVAGLRFEDGVESGSEITTAFDPMIAKVVAHAPTRTQAAGVLARSLAALTLHGPVTNRDYLVQVLRSEDYLAGTTTTAFVGDHPELLAAGVADQHVHLVAATLVGSIQRRRCDRRWGFAPAGFRNLPSAPLRFTYDGPQGHIDVDYTWSPFDTRRCTVMIGDVTINAKVISARTIDPHTDALTLDLDGITHTATVRVLGERTWVNTADGQTEWREVPRFPDVSLADAAGGPIAPVPGRVVAVNVTAGQHVNAGDVLVVMEAMKMEHRIETAADGIVGEVLCAIGDQVDAHQVLVTVHHE
jgi:acetyl/propionyl-CoA carboxylase alpha subunit